MIKEISQIGLSKWLLQSFLDSARNKYDSHFDVAFWLGGSFGLCGPLLNLDL